MEKAGEKPIEEVIGRVLITVYNDCFTVEHSATLSTEDVVGVFINTLNSLTGSEQEEQKRNIH